MNIDKARAQQCVDANCTYQMRCLTLFGKNCTKLGGNKIPVMRVGSDFPAQRTHSMKPYWIVDGKATSDGR